ncbi:hypothetical protein F5884DRAFT_856943 [Xylogone sp. PMI_703]|nr:hypothetical protein F5884DRAFT_856943 [Xylogone sp. PMI_703]
MAEVLGVVAAAAQLTGYCNALCEIVQKIKNSTSTLQYYQSQINGLRNIARTIENNQLYCDNKEIVSRTFGIIEALEEFDCSAYLRRCRLYHIWAALHKNRKLEGLFQRLEEEKSSLSLCILSVHASTLHEINSNIKTMGGGKATPDLANCGENLQPSHHPGATASQEPHETYPPDAIASQDNYDNKITASGQPGVPSPIASDEKQHSRSPSDTSTLINPQDFYQAAPSFYYKKNEKTGNGDQVNGGQVNRRVDHLPSFSATYEKNEHGGAGDQINGFRFD